MYCNKSISSNNNNISFTKRIINCLKLLKHIAIKLKRFHVLLAMLEISLFKQNQHIIKKYLFIKNMQTQIKKYFIISVAALLNKKNNFKILLGFKGSQKNNKRTLL